MDLDDRQRPQEQPQLFDWATPEGWRKGLRPVERMEAVPRKQEKRKAAPRRYPSRPRRIIPPENAKLIQEIEAFAEALGKPLYRGLLKGVAHVWNPNDIRDHAVLRNVLSQMQAAEQELGSIKLAQEKISQDELRAILADLEIKSLGHIANIDALRRLGQTLNEKITTSLS